MNQAWSFSCETKNDIPLPPAYKFPQAFNYLDAEKNSFYILTAPNGDYIQCGGGRKKCMVEIRKYLNASYVHYVVGKNQPAGEQVSIPMSHGQISVYENEVLSRWNAIDLFTAFYEGNDIPHGFVLRKCEFNNP